MVNVGRMYVIKTLVKNRVPKVERPYLAHGQTQSTIEHSFVRAPPLCAWGTRSGPKRDSTTYVAVGKPRSIF